MYLLTWKEKEWQICPRLTLLFMGTSLHTSSFSSLSNLQMASLRLWVLQCFWVAKLWRKISVTDCLSLHTNLLWVNAAFLFSSCSNPMGHLVCCIISGGAALTDVPVKSLGGVSGDGGTKSQCGHICSFIPSSGTTQGKLWSLYRRKGLMRRQWTHMKVCFLL